MMNSLHKTTVETSLYALLPNAHVSLLCFQLPYELRGGPANMALDEALLDHAAGSPGAALLRTYGWIEPTLSLGYFQALEEAIAQPRWRDVPVVRRPTGGGAIWHDRELTYALVLPADHPHARPSRVLYQCVHLAIATVLRGHGVDARRRADTQVDLVQPRHRSTGSTRPLLCFTDGDPEDLIVDGRKVVGSAQRRRQQAILQHGSLLLEQSGRTPELPGIADLAGVSPDPRFWNGLIQEAILRALGLDGVMEEVPGVIRRRASELEHRVYETAEWTARR